MHNQRDQQGGQEPTLTRREVLGVAGLALTSGGVLAGCGSSGGAPRATSASLRPRYGGSVQAAVGDASVTETIDPQRPLNQNWGLYVPLAWETLLQADQNWNLHPLLATSWSSDASLRRWTFNLRPGVTWHDGSPFTAQDVVWSIQRLFEPAIASPIFGLLSVVLDRKDIKAVDDHTVVVTLSEPDAFFPQILATSGTMMIKAGQNKFSLHNAAGTGPFKFQSFEAGQGWSVIRNPRYWRKGLPYLDEIRGVSISDPTGMVEAVTSGASHVSTSIDFSQIPVVEASGTAKVLLSPAQLDSYIVMDGRHKPFDDARVRQAIKLAENRRQVLSVAYQGNGVLTSDAPAPASDPFYPTELGVRPQQIAQAKQLLSEAGHPNGLDLTLYTSELLGGMVDAAVTFSRAVAAAGIRVTLKQHPAATYFDQIWLQQPFYTTWLTRTHPALRVPLTMATYSVWHETNTLDSKVDSLVAAAQSATDPATQKQQVQAMLDWVANNDGYASAAFEDVAIAAKRNLQGVTFPANIGPYLANAWLS